MRTILDRNTHSLHCLRNSAVEKTIYKELPKFDNVNYKTVHM